MIGETLNNYRIVSLLGEGGMGSVYLAEHPFMGRKAAIKVLRREFAEDRGLVERFMNEARAANAIRHPNIIDIIDVGRMPNGIPYLMMEFLEGVSLAARIAQLGRFEVTHAVDVIVQAASALTAAHSKGIVHRDLKPDNLFLCPDDSAAGGERVKVLDFGIAKLRGDLGNDTPKTQSGSLMGTPPYMSPEQCRGLTDDIDHRTDVYALGIILYEMLCGAPPFVGAGFGEIILAHMIQEPAPPRTKNPAIPEAVEKVILKALAKKAADRFASTTEMRGALLPFSSSTTLRPRMTVDTIPARPSPTQHSTFREATGEMAVATDVIGPAKRRRNLVLLAGGAVVAAGGIALWGAARHGGPGAGDLAARPVSAPIAAPAPPGAATAPTAPAPPPVAPAPRESPPPAHPRQIVVRLTSDPAGALVTDAKRGVRLGTTPLEQRMDRGGSSLDLRVAKEGFRSAELSVPLDADFDRAIRLEHRSTRASVAAGRLSHPSKPVAAPSGTGAGVPAAVSPPPASSEPATPKPKKIDKW